MATIKEVAKRAKVSTATVSYVINKTRYVSEELVKRVETSIKELNYKPSRIARSLRKGNTMTIGLLIDDITHQFGAEFTRGLESIARKNDYSVIISDLNKKARDEGHCLDILLNQQVDGIIYSGCGSSEERLLEIEKNGIPVIAVDKPLETKEISSILIDNEKSVWEAMEYLVKIGHRRICYVAGFSENPNTRIRVEAFKYYLLMKNLPFDEGSIFYGDYSLSHGYKTALEISDYNKYTAYFCGDDMVAFGAITALKQKKIRIPEDVAVVGFDNVPMASFFDPSLTTINYPMKKMGEISFELFLKLISRKRKKIERIVLDTELKIRKSTDKDYSGTPDIMD